MSAVASRAALIQAELRQAIDWRIRLDSGNATPDDLAALERWLAADPKHRAAWERIEATFMRPARDILDAERQHAGMLAASRHALTRPPVSRRKLVSGAAGLVLGVGATALVNRLTPVSTLLAELRTGTHERRAVALADGTELMLDARSAVDSDMAGDERRLRLLGGQVALRIAPDRQRPFVIRTSHGAIEATHGHLTVQQSERFTRVAVLERQAAVLTGEGLRRTLGPGESVKFERNLVGTPVSDAAARSAWTDGVLDVSDEPLGEVIEALRSYTAGLIRISPEAGTLRVFGVFMLDDPLRALRSLGDTLPIAIRRVGPWLTLIDKR